MPKNRTAIPPPKVVSPPAGALGILELERFSQETLARWNAVSKDLDELQASLYFGVQPEQRRARQALIEALQQTHSKSLHFSRWTRIVTYQYSMEPLAAAGSLHGFGGRFNAGADLDQGTLSPWPSLYIAEDYETAFREKFQMPSTGKVDGLSPQELALVHSISHTTLFVNGDLMGVFDMTSPSALDRVAKVFGRIKMPASARDLRKKLRISPNALWMVSTGRQLYDAALTHNWRTLPAQFGLPAPGHTLAELIRAAGFEAILYKSTKGQGRCLAVFPDLLASRSFVELADLAPTGVKHRRLDVNSGDELAGWDSLPSQKRPR